MVFELDVEAATPGPQRRNSYICIRYGVMNDGMVWKPEVKAPSPYMHVVFGGFKFPQCTRVYSSWR